MLAPSLVPIRNKGKLPFTTVEESYALAYGSATVTEGAAIVDLPELGGSARLKVAGLPLFTLLDFAGH